MFFTISIRQETNRHFTVIGVLVCGYPDGSLQRPLEITFLRVHFQKLEPRFLGESHRIEASLIRFLCFFFVVKPDPQVSKNLPLHPGLLVGYALSLVVGDFCSEDGPNPQILGDNSVGCDKGRKTRSVPHIKP